MQPGARWPKFCRELAGMTWAAIAFQLRRENFDNPYIHYQDSSDESRTKALPLLPIDDNRCSQMVMYVDSLFRLEIPPAQSQCDISARNTFTKPVFGSVRCSRSLMRVVNSGKPCPVEKTYDPRAVGRKYDGDGRLAQQWSKADVAEYTRRTNMLVRSQCDIDPCRFEIS